MKNYKLVGLTGTTGAGKGKVAQFFQNNGYAIINADFLAREIMDNQVVLSSICNAFGEDVVTDGVLNRKLLAQRAFESKEKTQLLNSITHPFIGELFAEKLESLQKDGYSKIVFDAPQLFESKLNLLCDVVVSVLADADVRIKRIIERDSITRQQAEKRIAVQFDDEFFRANSDYVIENNSTLEKLKANTQFVIDNI